MSFELNGELIPVGGGDNIPLIRERLVIGRRESCDICLRFSEISQQHAELFFHDGYWYIRDLNSTNGIKVNGQRLGKKLLHPGDEVSIGRRRKFTIQYTLVGGRRAMEELEEEEEEVMGQSLLEKAGLEKPKRHDDEPRRMSSDPADYLLEEDEEEAE